MTDLNVLELGQLEAPLLIFGGNYSNLQASQALQKWAVANDFQAQQCICTGDIVAYCGNPYETVELIRDWGVHCIQGNVEQSLATKADDCGCGFDENTTCDILSRGWYPIADAAVKQDQRDWFKKLPEHLQFSIVGKTVRVVHGAVSDTSRFMFDSQDDKDFLDEFALTENNQSSNSEASNNQIDIIIAGHSGLPFTKTITQNGSQKLWHNSGALGMPANDGTKDVWFSVLELVDGDLTFTHHRLEYEVESAYQQMIERHLTQGYHQALNTGLWPSMDVLPEFEKKQQGIEIWHYFSTDPVRSKLHHY